MSSKRTVQERESDLDDNEGRRFSKRFKASPASPPAGSLLAKLVARLLKGIEELPPGLAIKGFAMALEGIVEEELLAEPSIYNFTLHAIGAQINTLTTRDVEADSSLLVQGMITRLNNLKDLLPAAHEAARKACNEQAAMPPPPPAMQDQDKVDITDQLVAKWSQPIPISLNLPTLRNYLQQPLAEDEKIPIPQNVFDRMSRNPSFVEDPTRALSAEQLATLFRVSTDEAPTAERLFAYAIEQVPPVGDTKDLFHATWDNNISSILRFILSYARHIRNSNRNTSTALKRPDFGFLIKNTCVLRGEERGSDSDGDPRKELVDKLIWTHDPLPYILGYHAIATEVDFVAITAPPLTTVSLFHHDLEFKKDRVANLVHLIRLSGVVARLGEQLHRRNRAEFIEFEREGGLVRMSIGAVIKKEFRHPDAVARVSKLIEIYELLERKAVPNVDKLEGSNTREIYPYVELSPVGQDKLPESGSDSLNAVVCVLQALKVMHSDPNPVYHRDIREPNIIKRFDGKGWFLIDWSDASTAPTRAATHLKESEHSPRVHQDDHGAEVDIWGVGRYMENLASRVTCGIAKPDAVRQMARRWMRDLTTSVVTALEEINANQDFFTVPAAQIS